MRPHKKISARKPRAKKSFNVKKCKCDTTMICLVALVAVLASFLILGQTGEYPGVASFFDLTGYFKMQMAFMEHTGKIMTGFTDKLVADASQSIAILGEAHGSLIAKAAIKPIPGVETPFDVAVGAFGELGYTVQNFSLKAGNDFTLAFNDVGESLNSALPQSLYSTALAEER